jgi:hypothetical protein
MRDVNLILIVVDKFMAYKSGRDLTLYQRAEVAKQLFKSHKIQNEHDQSS